MPWVTSRRSSSAGDQRTSPVCPPRPWSACSIARSTEIAMSPMWVRARPHGRSARRPRARSAAPRGAGTTPAGASGRTARRSGRRRPCARVERRRARRHRSGRRPPTRVGRAARRRAPRPTVPGERGRRQDARPGAVRPGRPATAGDRSSELSQRRDPPADVAGAAQARWLGRSPADRRRPPPGAIRARRPCSAGRRPLVVHPEELGDEGLADALEVAQRQVALVELAVLEPLLDDPATIARIAGSSRDAASGPTPRRRRRA